MTKILLVEDDKSLREIYGVRLLAEGYDIVSAGDGEEALAMAIKEKPELIISDVMMPKISGFDMLDILRSTTETRDIKVIMMTALSSDDQRARGEQLGADRYLVKSQVGIEDVVRTVHEVLNDAGKVAPKAEAEATPDVKPADAPVAEPVHVEDAPVAEVSSSESVGNEAEPVAEAPVPALSSPGNEDAGPLPPQPTELVESLPQPTAPFSSPRPNTLGEQIVSPEPAFPVAPVVAPVDGPVDVSVPEPETSVVSPELPPVEENSAPVVPEFPVSPPEVSSSSDSTPPPAFPTV